MTAGITEEACWADSDTFVSRGSCEVMTVVKVVAPTLLGIVGDRGGYGGVCWGLWWRLLGAVVETW